jgi:hypothetical protein
MLAAYNVMASASEGEALCTSPTLCAMPTYAEKSRGRRVLFPLKLANIAAFCLYDRAASRLQAGVRQRERVTRGHIPPPPLTSFERFQPESAY